jgi:hypothetical protein
MHLYILHVHNEHSPETSVMSDGAFYGPYTLEQAKAELAEHVALVDDILYGLFDGDLTAGYEMEDLEEADRDPDLAAEMWAEIVPLWSLRG